MFPGRLSRPGVSEWTLDWLMPHVGAQKLSAQIISPLPAAAGDGMSFFSPSPLLSSVLDPVCPRAFFLPEHQNHARELVRKADLSQWDALVILSGDGLLFEVGSALSDHQ